jgi:hypothetical protein
VSVPSIPNAYTITMAPQPLQVGATVNAGMDDIRIREIAPVTLTSDSRVTTRSRIEMADIGIRIKEMPSMRVHMPMHYDFGVSLLGMELLTFSLCGEGMVITEPYEPNECEVCGPARHRPIEIKLDATGHPVGYGTELGG